MENLDSPTLRAALSGWLTRKIPGIGNFTLSSISRPKGGGHSAETFLFDITYAEDGQARTAGLVLRRELKGDELFLDSDLLTPWRAMEGLAKHTDVPVPRLVGIEVDKKILGSPFFVMGRVEGQTVPQTPNYNVEGWVVQLAPAQQTLLWYNGIEVMAKVHAVDWRCGFEFLNRPERGEPGLDQYLSGIAEWHRWAGAGRAQPVADAALDYLLANKPSGTSTNLVWGDSIPANILFAADLSVAAVIDWEAVSIGPGEIDLGWWLVFDEFFSTGFGVPRLPALPDRKQSIAIYEAAARRKVIDIEYFEILALLKLAIISTRGMDRQIRLGEILASSTAYLNNPITSQLARRLGLPVPEVGEDFFELLKASTRHQI